MQEVLIQRPLSYNIANFHRAILHDHEKWSRLFSISIESSLAKNGLVTLIYIRPACACLCRSHGRQAGVTADRFSVNIESPNPEPFNLVEDPAGRGTSNEG